MHYILQEEDVEMDDETSSQEGAVTSNNNDSTVVAVNNAIDLGKQPKCWLQICMVSL